MKPRLVFLPGLGLALLALAALALILAAGGIGCHRPQRNDWRSPSQTKCATDADCQTGSTCTTDPGTNQGYCSGAAVLPLLPADGGAPPPPAPGPNVQPAPGDIQI